MHYDRRELKGAAKQSMRTSVPKAIWVSLVYFLIVNVLSRVSQSIIMATEFGQIMADVEAYIDAIESGYLPSLSEIEIILILAIEVVTTIIGLGFTMYALRISRGGTGSFGMLFDGFSLFFKVIWLNIRLGVVVFLWSLLLFVPGIIAAYRYRLSIYLLIDHPDWSAKRCMRESAQLMRGYKWQMFKLEFSFIGWLLLAMLPLLSVVSIYVTPYTQITYCIFYNKRIGWAPEAPPEPSWKDKAPWEY